MSLGFGQFYALLGLVFQVALLAFAIRSYRAERTCGRLFFLCAVVCFVLGASSWFTFPFTAGLLFGSHLTAHGKLVLADLSYYAQQTFEMLFVIFMIAAFLSLFHRDISRDVEDT